MKKIIATTALSLVSSMAIHASIPLKAHAATSIAFQQPTLSEEQNSQIPFNQFNDSETLVYWDIYGRWCDYWTVNGGRTWFFACLYV